MLLKMILTSLLMFDTFFQTKNRFRARGPSIHRKMDLSQVPRGPIGSKDDPLADPYDDPSYGFGFRTSEYQRREDADSSGRVRGDTDFTHNYLRLKHIICYRSILIH